MTATPLTFEAITEGDITFSITYSYDHPVVLAPVEYKINDGSWTTYASWPANAASITSGTGNWPVTFGDAIHVAAGDKVSFRGDNASYYGNGTGYESHITSTADVYVYGNVMSLVDADDFATLTTLTGSWNFAKLFNAGYDNEYAPVTNTTIKSHATNDLVLSATTITSACYFGMFAGCRGITRAPELPTTTLEAQCYAEMFRATGLTTAPALPATEMRAPYFNSPSDYSEGTMDCYMQMFQDCTSLTVAPVLPATTLVHGVYQNMFEGCTSLVNAPALPAAKVADGAYYRMFYGCTSLNYVKCLATDISEDIAVDEWMDGVPASGTFVKADAMSSWPSSSSGIPAGWTVKNVSDETAEMAAVPLTLEATEEGTTISIANPLGLTIEYSTNGGTTWTSASAAPITISGIAAGTLVQLRGNNAAYATSTATSNSTIISSDKAVYVYGNIMSLINSTLFASLKELTADYAFANLFYYSTQNSTITSHPYKALVLPATKLTRYCYANMFRMCRKVSIAPSLPATTLTEGCYNMMFWGCNTMLSAPELPAMSLADYCYTGMFGYCTKLVNAPALPATAVGVKSYQTMFRNCTSLVNAPALPATTLATYCYDNMFLSCTKLVNAPALPATTLANYCYNDMFSGCTALTTAPDLPATTLVEGCYACMFVSCSSLNYVRCLATDLGTGGNTNDWMRGVAATGTFVKAVNADWSGRNTDIDIAGIPDGWTVKAATAIVTANSDGEGNYWATCFNDADGYIADANTTVYTAKLNNDKTKVELTAVADKTIPAGNAVVLKSTAASITMTYAPDATGMLADNDLQGSATAITTPANTYMLTKGNSGVGFYHWTGAEVPAGRAYLVLPDGARGFLSLDGDDVTGVDGVAAATADDALYDLSGRSVTGQPRPGIYVKRGKKIIVK